MWGGVGVINQGRECPEVHISAHKCAQGYPLWPHLYLVPYVEPLVLRPG